MALWEITIQQLSNRDARERWVCEIQYDRRRPPLRAQSFDEMISLIRLEHDTILAQQAKKKGISKASQAYINGEHEIRGFHFDEPLPPPEAEQHAVAEEAVTAPVDAAAPEQKAPRLTEETRALATSLGITVDGRYSEARVQRMIAEVRNAAL